jgi:integrase
VTVEDVIAYRDDLVKKKRRKARTVNLKLSVVRALTPEEVVRLINAPDRSQTEGAQDHALLLVLARTSLRVSEVRNLRVSSIL